MTALREPEHDEHVAPPTLPPPRAREGSRPGDSLVPLVIAIDCLAAAAATTMLGVQAGLMLSVTAVCLNAAGGLYRSRLAPSLLDELPGLLARCLVAAALVIGWRGVTGLPVSADPVTGAFMFFGLACLGRAVCYPLIRRGRAAGSVSNPTVIVGCGQVGDRVAGTLLDHPQYGMHPIGFVDDAPLLPASQRRVPLLGGPDALPRLLRRYHVRNVIVAFSSDREAAVIDLLRSLDGIACEIFFVPRFYELHRGNMDTELVWGIPLTRLRRATFRTVTWRCKRAFDAVAAAIALVVLSPLFALCALAVRLEGGPGTIFRQERVGLDGEPFTMLKFRSLEPTSELESTSRWTVGGDANIGAVGKLLRRTSLDELPQLWNVLRGDMSLVGPRPERPYFVQTFTERYPGYTKRHRVPAGITGWAQVNGLRGDTDISDRARFDNFYIENWSLWEDTKIVLRTVAQIFGARGQ